jgi:hypothetical protein
MSTDNLYYSYSLREVIIAHPPFRNSRAEGYQDSDFQWNALSNIRIIPLKIPDSIPPENKDLQNTSDFRSEWPTWEISESWQSLN